MIVEWRDLDVEVYELSHGEKSYKDKITNEELAELIKDCMISI